jgi:membrane-bound ClpP family serine protease
MQHEYVIWSVVCLATALLLFFIEVFIPSGGILGIAAAVALLAGIILLFKVSTTLGLIGAIVCMAAIPVLFALAVKMWPSTPLAQLLTLQSQSRGEAPAPETSDLVGRRGRSLTALRPVGTCLINGKRLDCLAVGDTIEPNRDIEVVAVDGMHVKVRPVS